MALSEFQKERLWQMGLWAITRVVLPLLLLLWAMLFVIQRGAMKTLAPLSRYGHIEYEQVTFDTQGKVHFTKPSLLPYGRIKTDIIRADVAEVKTPGLMWLLRAAFASASKDQPAGDSRDKVLALPKSTQLQWRFENLQYQREPFSLGRSNWLGWRTGLPFERLGCGNSAKFNAEEFAKFSASDKAQQLTVSFRAVDDSAFVLKAELERIEANRVQLELTLQADEVATAYNVDPQSYRVVSQNWQFDDQRFMRNRNRMCARNLSMGPDEFVNRHVEAVLTHLASLGMFPTQPLVDQYREFVREGGQLEFQSKPSGVIPFEQLLEMQNVAQNKAMRASFKPGKLQSVPFLFEFSDVPEGSVTSVDGSASSPIAATENEPETSAGAGEATSQTPQQSDPNEDDPLEAPVSVSETAKPTVEPTTTTLPAPPIETKPIVVPSKPVAIPAPVTTTEPPVSAPVKPVVPANTTVTEISVKPAPATPVKRSPGPPRKFVDLENYVGRRVLIGTAFGTTRVGRIKAWTPFGIEMDVETADGVILMTFSKNQVKSVGLP